jgi:hypothetical protein
MRGPIDYSSASAFERRIRREQYVADQGGRCWHCTFALDTDPPEDFREQWPIAAELDRGVFPAGFLNYPVHLHHDHDSGQSIGAVHAYCNAILWVHHGE